MLSPLLYCLATATLAAASSNVYIESFAKPSLHWKQANDPVMGGKSTGTFKIDHQIGTFNGDVVDVPFLKAPGFIKVSASGKFPDVSTCDSLVLFARSSSNYSGFRVSFGTAHANPKSYAYGYKAHFDAPVGDSMSMVRIPFNMFSDLWNDGTGALIKTCREDSKYCPDTKTLQDMQDLSIWGEGVGGQVDLEIGSIYASGCETLVEPLTDAGPGSCSAEIQPALRYNISNTLAAQEWALPVPPGETLASAVCCDASYKAYAEPPHMFARPDIDLFAHMNKNGTTTFYDSVCGQALFIVPKGRTMADFEADTTEHGWPSFRSEELIAGSSHIVNETGEVLSKCGTHLGSYLPDDKGPRWCLDLSCVSGNPK